MLFQEDPILRQIKKLAEALASLSGASAGDGHDAPGGDRAELDELHSRLFAMPPAMTGTLAPATLAAMVAPHQLEAAATLLQVESALARRAGDERTALIREAQARALTPRKNS